MMTKKIQIETLVQKPIEKVWDFWTAPKHITNWNFANDDWHCPKATNDLRKGGKFSSTMASKDGKMSFDFGGVYDEVITCEEISYSLEDQRKVTIYFENTGDDFTKITTYFEPEKTNSIEIQKGGWQAILDNFKKYVEAS